MDVRDPSTAITPLPFFSNSSYIVISDISDLHILPARYGRIKTLIRFKEFRILIY